MQFFFKKSQKLNEILQRPDISDEEFLQKLQLSDELALRTVSCVRTELGKFFKIPPTKLYPDDKFREILSLPCWEWDMMELVLALEESLEIDIDEEQVPNWTSKDVTLGKWIVEFLSRCFLEKL